MPLIRLLLVTTISPVTLSLPANALEFSAGIGSVESGDDRGHGAAIAHLGFSNGWMGRAYLWGRTQGPVTETSGILSAAKRFDLFGSKDLRGSYGFSALAENTTIKYKDYPEDSSNHTSTNFGVMLGMHYNLLSSKAMTVTASWDSHIYAAGDAIILLVTGRKQILGLTAGLAF